MCTSGKQLMSASAEWRNSFRLEACVRQNLIRRGSRTSMGPHRGRQGQIGILGGNCRPSLSYPKGIALRYQPSQQFENWCLLDMFSVGIDVCFVPLADLHAAEWQRPSSRQKPGMPVTKWRRVNELIHNVLGQR